MQYIRQGTQLANEHPPIYILARTGKTKEGRPQAASQQSGLLQESVDRRLKSSVARQPGAGKVTQPGDLNGLGHCVHLPAGSGTECLPNCGA